MEREKMFYNACAIGTRGAWRSLSKKYKVLGSWEAVWEELADQKIAPEVEYAKLGERGVEIRLQGEVGYPDLLKEIPDAPLALYVRGEIPTGETVAIVGTRRATPEGKNIAREMAESLGRAGVTVVSGLALGIDAVAHEGSLIGKGKTVAVLASGLDNIYPRQNERLAMEILKNGGGLVSEYPLESEPLPYRFLERNRITSGLASKGVIIIEAPQKSGAIATAGFAGEQGRDVYVVPGNIRHPNWRGSHKLIRDGGRLVTTIAELFEDMELETKEDKKEWDLTENQTIIVQGLAFNSSILECK